VWFVTKDGCFFTICEVVLVIEVLFLLGIGVWTGTGTGTASCDEFLTVVMLLLIVFSLVFGLWDREVALVDLVIEVLFWNGSKGWTRSVVLFGCEKVVVFGKKYEKMEENWEVEEEGVVVEIVGEGEKAKKRVKAMKTSIKA